MNTKTTNKVKYYILLFVGYLLCVSSVIGMVLTAVINPKHTQAELLIHFFGYYILFVVGAFIGGYFVDKALKLLKTERENK